MRVAYNYNYMVRLSPDLYVNISPYWWDGTSPGLQAQGISTVSVIMSTYQRAAAMSMSDQLPAK